ncbi:MAG TPA: response regulator [Herpetosiphonaceae bacterium]
MAGTRTPAAFPDRLPMHRQLRWQLIAAYVLLACVPLLIVGVLSSVRLRAQTNRDVFTQLESAADLKRDQIQDWIQNSTAALEVLLSPPIVATMQDFAAAADRSADQARITAILQAATTRSAAPEGDTIRFQSLFLYTPDGQIIAASDPRQLGRIVTRQPYFEPSLRGNHLQPPFYAVGSSELVMVSTYRLVDDDGRLVAVFGGELDLTVLGRIMLRRNGLGASGETYLVSHESQYLLTPSRFPGYPLTRAYHSEGIDRGLSGQDGAAVYENYRAPAETVLGVYRWVPELQAVLMAEITRDEAFASSDASLRVNLLVILATSLAAVAVGLIVATRIARPVLALKQTAARIAGGAIEQRANISASNEIGVLADGFNTMAARLQETLQGLEQRVIERTADAEAARAAAEQANALKTRFLANMSHELRTPLNAIINFSKFVEADGGLSEEQTHLLQRVRYNGEHLLGIINDILDLSKIEAGRIEIMPQRLDLRPMLESLMATAAGLTKDKEIDLILDLPEELPAVWADPARTRQIMLNLLSNAAKFTEAGAITVRAFPADEGGLAVAVSDSGIGVAPADQARIFEEFQQVHDHLTSEYQGTGLGLPISRRLAEMQGGRMWLESTPGEGATFCFTLPLAPAPGEAADLGRPQALAAATGDAVDIVIIDDDEDAQTTLQRLLGDAGYAAVGVRDSRMALSLLHQRRPRLILLDIQMPHMTGWEVLAAIKETPELAAIPVIVCSITDERRLGVLLGVQDHLVKPIQEESLLQTVRRAVQPPATVAVIDDDPDSRRILRTLLERAGWRVAEAVDGIDGLALIDEIQPELVVLDLMMPRLDGFGLLDRLQERPPERRPPVLVVSAKELEPQEQALLRQQTIAQLQKGQLSADAFLAHVAGHLTGGPTHG